MVNVKMSKMCGCAKRAKIEEIQTFDNPDTALIEANKLAKKMNETFCKKHNFTVVENGNDEIVIELGMNR